LWTSIASFPWLTGNIDGPIIMRPETISEINLDDQVVAIIASDYTFHPLTATSRSTHARSSLEAKRKLRYKSDRTEANLNYG
jgi:hypothetical protein